jgi:hypothetical protein
LQKIEEVGIRSNIVSFHERPPPHPVFLKVLEWLT